LSDFPLWPDDVAPRSAVVCKRCNEQARLVYLYPEEDDKESGFGVECACGVQEIDSVEWGERRSDEDGLDWFWSNQDTEGGHE